MKADALLADYIIEAAQAMGAEVIIPQKSNRIIQHKYGKASYIRSVILLKDYSNKLKNYRQDSNALGQNSRGIHTVNSWVFYTPSKHSHWAEIICQQLLGLSKID